MLCTEKLFPTNLQHFLHFSPNSLLSGFFCSMLAKVGKVTSPCRVDNRTKGRVNCTVQLPPQKKQNVALSSDMCPCKTNGNQCCNKETCINVQQMFDNCMILHALRLREKAGSKGSWIFANWFGMGSTPHPLQLTRSQASCLIALGAPMVLPETQTKPSKSPILSMKP